MKHNIYEFSLYLKILCFVSKRSLNIPEYRCLLIGRVQYLYTIEHAVENIAYHRLTILSLIRWLKILSPSFDVIENVSTTCTSFLVSGKILY